MALVLKDRVLETASSPGTGTVSLLGASTGYQTFANAIGGANTTYYTIADVGGNNWEVGIGVYNSGNNSVTRQTVLASSNAGNLTNFSSGTQSVFVTYPAEESVYLSGGNVSALGNITSATWNATTVGVGYGGTGVTASSGANSVVLRDSNTNINFNNAFFGLSTTVSANATTTLLASSSYYQRLTGSSPQTFQLPNATTLSVGVSFIFDNDSTGNLTVVDNGSNYVDLVPSGGIDLVTLMANGTSNGTWGVYAFLPASVNWGTNTADFGGTTLSNATWNGVTIGTAYGGTGLTSFTANSAVYATSNNSLTTGTLPVYAGGTGFTSLTAGYIPYGNGSNALASTANLSYANNTVIAPYFNATGAVTANVAYGAFNNGNLGYTDTGIFGSFVTSQNSYGQWILQNTNSGNAASADYIVSNNLGANNAYYGDLGINSSTFAGSGSLSLPNAVYLYSSNGDMVVGTITGNNFRVVTNNSTTDAITVNINNAVAFNNAYGTSGYLFQSGGSTGAPSWIAPANITAGSVTNLLTFTNTGNGASTGVSFNGSAAQTVSSNTILPAQSGNGGKFLTTDGANNVSWSNVTATVSNVAASTGNSAIVLNNVNITSNATIAAGVNGFSVGPITQANGTSITINSGSRWVVI